ncbi:hypothetical protein VNO78_23153 [Psophocarpus tetragonolobus]|uniref:GH18 domain-containing protein n=1 Tax=Psophocarpus tetragonolobus TaxID=3891 RepID=A0AAN9S659_PSOTE
MFTMAMAMAYSKKYPFVISLVLLVLHFHASSAAMKGGYWFREIRIPSANAAQFSTFTQTVQQKNPSVKTLLSIGGGASNPSTFSSMASQASSRKTFIDSSIQVARSNNFHGIDVDWEYPSSLSDMSNYGILLREWRSALVSEARTSGKAALFLAAAVFYSSSYHSLPYDVQALSESLDWLNVMAYDFYGPLWYPNRTAPPAALYAVNHSAANQVSGDIGIRAWIGSGMAANKLVLGLPFYGYAWRLLNVNNNGLFAPANGSAFAGDGSIGYNGIRAFISQNRAPCVYNSSAVSNYCYSGTTWIGYDDVQSISTKVTYAKTNKLCGHFVWHVGADYNWVLSQTPYQTWG